MSYRPAKLPVPDEAIKLPVTALATSILKYIDHVTTPNRRYVGRSATIRAEQRDHWGDNVRFVGGTKPAAPSVSRQEHARAMSEAFDWLYIEGLTSTIPEPPRNSPNDDWFAATDRGRQFLTNGSSALAHHRAEQLLGFKLHRLIDRRVRQLFLLGETEAAVMIAMKEVEVHMRDLSELPNDLVGVQLATATFKPGEGPLTDLEAERGEQEATMALFRGAMGTLRNPVAHRRVDYTDPVEAVEVILFADLLLRMIDRANEARA